MTETEIIEKYNLSELFDKLTELLQRRLAWTAEIKKTWNKIDYLFIQSEDIASEAGIMAPVYKSLCLRTFNSEFTADDKYSCWMTVDFMWEFKSGGSNGHDFARCWLMKDGHWQVEQV